MVLGATANVGVTAFREQRMDGAARAQELERAVGGRETEPRLERSRPLVQLRDGEAPVPPADGFDDRTPLGGRAHALREGEVGAHGDRW